MFTLPLVDSILKLGEDGRGVKNGMTSFADFKSFFFAWAWAWAFARAFAFACHVHAQGKHFQGTS
jgi:hypothetical protein